MIFLMKECQFKVCPLRHSGSFVSADEGLPFVVGCWFFFAMIDAQKLPKQNNLEEKRFHRQIFKLK